MQFGKFPKYHITCPKKSSTLLLMNPAQLAPDVRRLIDTYLSMTPAAQSQVLKLAEVMAVRHPIQRPVLRLVAKQ
jgi:hypothetical protein